MSSLNIIGPNARRCPIKVTPGKLLREVLEEACLKQGYNPEHFDLVHQKKKVDLSLPFRLTGLPNNASIDLKEKENTQEAAIEIALQGPDGSRKVGKFTLDMTLSQMLVHFSKEFQEDLLKTNEILHPGCAFMNKQYNGKRELEFTTLRSMGLGGGKVLIRYHRVPMTAMDIAGIEERIEKEIHKKEVLTAEFEKKRTENEDRERIERQRMQKFEEEQRALQEAMERQAVEESKKKETTEASSSQQTQSNQQYTLPNSVNADPNAWSFDRHPFNPATNVPEPSNNRLTFLNNLLNNVDASLTGQTSSGQVDTLVERLASEGRMNVRSHENTSEQYPLMNFKFPDKKPENDDDNMDEDSKPENNIEAAERQSILFVKRDLNEATASKPEQLMEVDDKFFEVNIEDVRSMQRALSEQVKQEQQRALLPKAYVEAKNRELKLEAWKNTVVRVVFPDRRVLQARFYTNEPAIRVVEWISSLLKDEKQEFSLSLALHSPYEASAEKNLLDVGVAPSSTIYIKFTTSFGNDGFKADLVKEVSEDEANHLSKEWLARNVIYKPWVGTVGPEAPRPIVRRADEGQDSGPSTKREPPVLPKWLKR